MTILPKYFVIKWTDSPLWNEYIDWLRSNFKVDPLYLGDNRYFYYGIVSGTDGDGYGYIPAMYIKQYPQYKILTLEQWKEAISTPEPVKSKDMHRYFKIQLFPNSNKLAEELALMACMSNSGLNVTLDGLNNHAAEHLNGSSCTVNGNVLVLNQGERTVLIIEEREEFVMPLTKDY